MRSAHRPNDFDDLLTVLVQRHEAWASSKLSAVIDALRERFQAAQTPQVSEDRLTRAIEEFIRCPAKELRRTHLRALAFSMASPHVGLSGSAIVDHPKYGELLGALTASFHPLHWLGAFKAYLTLPAESGGVPLLRIWLKSTVGKIRALAREPGWWPPVSLHLELLEKRPEVNYVSEFWLGRDERINHLRRTVEVPATSWLWPSILQEACQRTIRLGDDEALATRVENVLELSDRFGLTPGHSSVGDRLLSDVLTRWAKVVGQPRNDRLLQRCLGSWGNPQLGLAGEAHHWSRVSEDVVRMVCGWVAEEDLRDFHELTRRNRSVEDDRLAYWLRYKKQISYTQLVIGDEIANSRDPDVVKFRKRKGARLGRLHDSTQSNNAIIIRLGDLWIVEFSALGNAAYPYSSKSLPFTPGASRHRITQLKNKALTWPRADTRLSHHHDWQAKFDAYLAGQGVWPDVVGRRPAPAKEPINVADHRAENDRFKAQQSQAAGNREVDQGDNRLEAFLSAGLPVQLARLIVSRQGRTKDMRSKGGALWIEFSEVPESSVFQGLKDAGFRQLGNTGSFWRT
jgi:hypothetical protein